MYWPVAMMGCCVAPLLAVTVYVVVAAGVTVRFAALAPEIGPAVVLHE